MLYTENTFANNILKTEKEELEFTIMYFENYSKGIANQILKIVKIRKPTDIFKGIHDFATEYDRYGIKKNINLNSVYNKELKKDIEVINKYSQKHELRFELPTDVNALFRYGTELDNCVYAYSKAVIIQSLVIIGIYINHRLFACLKLRGKTVVQLKTFSNKLLCREDFQIIKKYLKK